MSTQPSDRPTCRHCGSDNVSAGELPAGLQHNCHTCGSGWLVPWPAPEDVADEEPQSSSPPLEGPQPAEPAPDAEVP